MTKQCLKKQTTLKATFNGAKILTATGIYEVYQAVDRDEVDGLMAEFLNKDP